MEKRIPARALIECILCAKCNNYATATGGGICAACALTAERDQLRAEVGRLRGLAATKAALTLTPASAGNRIKAEVYREAARLVDSCSAETLHREADRLTAEAEKEAANGR